MPEKRFGRREFLKITVATVAAAGLSHFRILNLGGVDVAFAGLCNNGREDPDVCDASSADECNPPNDPDYCDISLPQDPDECGSPGISDICDLQPGDPDVCNAGSADECNPPSDPDYCDVSLPQDPDECGGLGISDTCDPQPGDPDICRVPGNIDACDPQQTDLCTGQGGVSQEPDVCNPGVDDPDDPNAVQVGTFNVESTDKAAFTALPILGSLAAVIGGATLWLRRLRASENEKAENA